MLCLLRMNHTCPRIMKGLQSIGCWQSSDQSINWTMHQNKPGTIPYNLEKRVQTSPIHDTFTSMQSNIKHQTLSIYLSINQSIYLSIIMPNYSFWNPSPLAITILTSSQSSLSAQRHLSRPSHIWVPGPPRCVLPRWEPGLRRTSPDLGREWIGFQSGISRDFMGVYIWLLVLTCVSPRRLIDPFQEFGNLNQSSQVWLKINMFGPPASFSNWQDPIKELGVVDPGLAFQYRKPPGCGFLGGTILIGKCSRLWGGWPTWSNRGS